MKILLFFTLSLIAFAEPKKCRLFIALCDNESQGIMPVSPRIGNGDQPDTNLYWGCYDGFGSYFKKSRSWKAVTLERNTSADVLRTFELSHVSKNAQIIAYAYKGSSMRKCINDFESAIQSGEYDLVAYIGHNPYMDFRPKAPQKAEKSTDVVVLACKSQAYFEQRIRLMNARPILLTSQYMYPGAFLLHDAMEEWLKGASLTAIRTAAGKAYAKNQKISTKAGTGVFAKLED